MRMKLYNSDKQLVGSIEGLRLQVKLSDYHEVDRLFENEDEWVDYKLRIGLMYENELNQLDLFNM